MKLLFILTLLFIGQLALADIRVHIESQKEGSFFKDFKTQAAADAYKAQVIADNHWGVPGTYTLTDEDITSLAKQTSDEAASYQALTDAAVALDGKANLTAADIQTIAKALIKLIKHSRQ